jgi:hypothetical protein
LFSLSERRLLAGVAVVTAASWGRFFATASLKVDESYPGRAAGYALLGALVAGWYLAVTAWRKLLEEPPDHPRATAFAGLAVASAMLPMLSNDVFSLFSYGALAADGHDVYTTTAWLSRGAFYPWLGAHWSDTVCVYGPTTLLATFPAALARGSPWIALLALRVAWIAPVAFVMEMSLRRLRDRPAFHAMVWLNPLWLVEGPGQMHADLLGLAAIVAGIVLHLEGRVRGSFGLYAAAVLGKYSFAPAGLWFWLARAWSPAQRGRRLVTLAAVVGIVGVVAYAPFWSGVETLAVPLAALRRMNPGGSITEVLGIVVQYVRTGSVTAPDMAVQSAIELDRATKQASWTLVSWVVRGVFVVVAARIVPAMLRKDASNEDVALGTGALTVALLTLASHRFQCWYLLAALPFFGLASTPAWRRWWVAAVAVAVPVDFGCVLERTSPVYPVWGAVTTGALVVVFVTSFRSRYFDLLRPGRGGARPATRAQEAPSPQRAGS